MSEHPEPNERDLPEKPPAEESLPEEGFPAPDDEDVPDDTYLAPERAADDPTVDDQEDDTAP